MGIMALPRSRTPRRSSRLLLAIEIIIWTLAIISLGIAIGMQVDAYIYQHTSQPPSVAHETPERVAHAGSIAQGASIAPMPSIAPGTPIARLVIPRLGLNVVVAEGSTDKVLRRAVGRLESSASPGDRGNIVLAGHRDTFFRSLSGIREGDLIVLASGAGNQRYRVEWARVVEPDDVQVLSRSSHAELTLVTCYPFRYVGDAPLRFVVRARGNES